MEADSVHSTLETMFGNGPIYAPSDYYALMQNTRPKQPYDLQNLDFRFFKDFEHMRGIISSIRPGKNAWDPHVTNLWGLLHVASGEILFKLCHSDSWTELPIRQASDTGRIPKPLYSSRLKIKADKFTHLQQFKPLIPAEFHPYYDLWFYPTPVIIYQWTMTFDRQPFLTYICRKLISNSSF